jgi:hypothetical protein
VAFEFKCEVLEMWERQANDTDLERQVLEIRVRAERRAGEPPRVKPKPKPRGSNQRQEVSRDPTLAQPLSKVVITHDQSFEWQKLAAVPEDEFKEELANPVALPTAAIVIAAHEAKNAAQE